MVLTAARLPTTSPLAPRRLAEKALAAVVQEAYVHGVSTCSVDDLVKAMGMTGISKSQVSRLCEEIYPGTNGTREAGGGDSTVRFGREHGRKADADIRHAGRGTGKTPPRR